MIAVRNNEGTVRERVLQVILDEADPDRRVIHSVNELQDSDLLNNLLDSLGRQELLIGLEEEFDIDIPDARSEQFRTVGDVVRHMEELVASRSQEN